MMKPVFWNIPPGQLETFFRKWWLGAGKYKLQKEALIWQDEALQKERAKVIIVELWHHSSERLGWVFSICVWRENLAKDNIVCEESRIWCIMYSTWILQRRMSREALSVSSSTFDNALLFWFTICKYRMCWITERLFKSVLHNQLHSMLSKFWILILWKNPPLILGNGVIYHELSLCAMNRRS